MKAIKNYSIVLVILMNSVFMSGQINTTVPHLTRSTPSVASLMNFEDIPVNLYTGVPDIGIPLYTFPTRSKDISFNIGLNYHPASISLVDRASDVGSGWSLMAGGSISRSVINFPDEAYNNGISNPYDDIYSFSFMGYSGKFLINRDVNTGVFSLQMIDDGNADLKISYVMNSGTSALDSFTIYDNKGYRYFFDTYDINAQNFYHFWANSGASPNTYSAVKYRSAFHLTKVFDNNNNELVTLTYNNTNTNTLGATAYDNAIKKLNEITVQGLGKAVFSYSYTAPPSAAEAGANDPFQLNEVTIKDVFNQTIKKYSLQYAATSINAYHPPADMSRRLLHKLSEFGKTGTTSLDHYLYYKDTLPGIDLNDYILGADGYGFLNAARVCSDSPGPNDEHMLHETNPVFSGLGVLEKIQYPTGGCAIYNYESNTFSHQASALNPSPLDSDYYEYNQIDNTSSSVFASNNYNTSLSHTFQFTLAQSKNLYFKFSHAPYSYPPGMDPDPGNTTPLDVTYSLSTSGVSSGNSFGFNQDYSENPDICLGKKILLPAGTYTITIHTAAAFLNTTGTITISEKNNNPILKRWINGLGVRIKKIAYFDTSEDQDFFNLPANAITTPAKLVSYEYNLFSDANKSSGELITDSATNADMFGAAIGYTNVKVSESPANGYHLYTFASPYENPMVLSPYYWPHYLAYKYGNMVKHEIWSLSGKLVSATENTFSYTESTDPKIVALNTRKSWAKLSNTLSKDYFYDAAGNNQKIVQASQGFTYNSLNKQIQEQVLLNSTGENFKTKYYYHTGNSTFSQNRIVEIEKVETYRDADLLTTAKINYLNTFAGNASYLPSTIEAFKESNTPETRVRYTNYDEFGNPLQVQQENGLITSYIWGYNKTQPIAKIENLAYTGIIPTTTITDLQTKSNADNDRCTSYPTCTGNEQLLRTALDALRTAYPNAMVTTYTYDPLVGVTSMTDSKGDRIIYEYDNFNRLAIVRDKDGRILNENKYDYEGSASSYYNSIKTKTYKVATTSVIASPTVSQAVEGVTYFDGLGRTIQKIAKAQSNSGKDIITHIEYDNLGRKVKDYLPFASTQNTMGYINGDFLKQYTLDQYQAKYGDANPYSEKLLESSPLNRVLEQAAPGNDWSLSNSIKHTIRFDYQTNAVNEVKMYKATSACTGASGGSYTISLVNGGGTVFYPEKELFKTITRNENWKTGDGSYNTTEEFKDKKGRVVMSRTYGVSVVSQVETPVWHEIYNVYDQHGNLTFVIPPKADGAITTTILDDVCYQYKYDHRNRLAEKKLPGKAWEFIVYDKLDRVVATGPALSPFSDYTAPNNIGWLITKYDVFNRPVYTGWENATVSAAARASKQNSQNGLTAFNETKQSSGTIDGIAAYYSNAITPTGFKLLTVNYYDSYAFPNPPANYSGIEGQAAYYTTTVLPKGMPAGSWIRVLSTSTAIAGESTYILYDYKARPLRTYAVNYLGGYTITDSNIDAFTGKLNYTVTRHKRLAADTEIYVKDAFTYTAQERLLAHTHQIGTSGTPQLLNKNNYDDLGQLASKQVGGTDVTTYVGFQKVDYAYNIRGWLLGINDVTDLKPATDNDLFAFSINYNSTVQNSVGNTIVPLYNGNIAEVNWRSKTDNIQRRYGFSYDHLNRLKNAVYQKATTGIQVTNSYDESVKYDKNGNITSLLRNGDLDSNTATIQIDNLAYTYDSSKANQLMKVFDAAKHPVGFKDDSLDGLTDPVDDYTYDDYGNLTADQNKGITATVYNHLNLPVTIMFGATNKIEYFYNALGERLKKKVTIGGSANEIDYLDGFQYEKIGTAAVELAFFQHSEGYVDNTVVSGVNVYNYVFNYTDHLGNIRASYAWDTVAGSLKIMEENHYYPYGMKHGKYNSNTFKFVASPTGGYNSGIVGKTNESRKEYQYKFNGKEYQEEFGLNMTMMDFRQYDSAIGRFVSMDALAESSYNLTPYHFGDDNPIFNSDPTGLKTFPSTINSGNAAVDQMWNQTAPGTNTSWVLATAFTGVDGIGVNLGVGGGDPQPKNDRLGEVITVKDKKTKKSPDAKKEKSAKNIKKVEKIKKIGKSAEAIVSGLEATGNASKRMKIIGKTGGYIATSAEIFSNGMQLSEGEIGLGRFSFRTLGTGFGAAAGEFAGPAGFLLGIGIDASFQAAENSFDIIAPQFQGSLNNFENTMNSASQIVR